MRVCDICNHPRRVEIENALFMINMGDRNEADEKLAKIAAHFGVDQRDLEEHMLFHASFSSEDSIARQIKMREADLLTATALDQLNTMKLVGKRIRKYAENDDEEDVRLARQLSKPMVDLYIGSGDGVRRATQAIADINQLLNGPKDDGSSGLMALAKALDMSRQSVCNPQEPAPIGQFNYASEEEE